MRLLHIMVLVASLQLSQNQAGAIEGIVTQAGTSFPIAGVQVKLRPPSRNNLPSPPLIEVPTDGAGAFAFRELASGPYVLEVSHEDYVFGQMPSFNPTMSIQVVVNPGQRVKVPVAAVRAASIRGRVLDGDGQGLPDMPVEILLALKNPQGGVVWRGIIGPGARTDEKGEYRRALLGPGQYVVRTTLERPDTPDRIIYAPGTTDANSALIVDLQGGSEVTADIHIASVVDASTYKISGKVTPVSKEPVSMVLRRRPVESDPLFALEGSPRTFADTDSRSGRFEFRNARPGIYELYATTSIDGKEYLTKSLVEVRNADVDDVDVVLHPAVDIQGKLVIEGDPRDLQIRGSSLPDDLRDPNRSHIGDVAIALRRTDSLFSDTLLRAEIDDDGVSFAFRNVPEGDYDFKINFLADGKPPSPDLYVADIRAGGRSVIDTGFQVGVDAVDAMEVVVGTRGASIKGSVIGRIPGASAFLILAPANVPADRSSPYNAMPIADDNQFEFRGLRPGSYRIFLIQATDLGLPKDLPPAQPGGPSMVINLRPEFFSKNEARGVKVIVEKGDTTYGVVVPFPPAR